MYNSPFKLFTDEITRDIAKKQDTLVFNAVARLGVTVDRDELLRALRYDREQYDAGFAAGYRAATPKWIPVEERLPQEFVSVLGYMIDAGSFPPVRECYVVGKAFFFPALRDVHPVSHWMPLPEPPIEEQNRAKGENDG